MVAKKLVVLLKKLAFVLMFKISNIYSASMDDDPIRFVPIGTVPSPLQFMPSFTPFRSPFNSAPQMRVIGIPAPFFLNHPFPHPHPHLQLHQCMYLTTLFMPRVRLFFKLFIRYVDYRTRRWYSRWKSALYNSEIPVSLKMRIWLLFCTSKGVRRKDGTLILWKHEYSS